MFKKQIKDSWTKIEQAQVMAYKAIDIFKKSLSDLEKSNESLEVIISEEEEQMINHKLNIATARDSISLNKSVIEKLREFTMM